MFNAILLWEFFIRPSPIPVAAGITTSPQARKEGMNRCKEKSMILCKSRQYGKRGQDTLMDQDRMRQGCKVLGAVRIGHTDKCCFVICNGCPMSRTSTCPYARVEDKGGPSQPNTPAPFCAKRLTVPVKLDLWCTTVTRNFLNPTSKSPLSFAQDSVLFYSRNLP